jgi:hypothetical protein
MELRTVAASPQPRPRRPPFHFQTIGASQLWRYYHAEGGSQCTPSPVRHS